MRSISHRKEELQIFELLMVELVVEVLLVFHYRCQLRWLNKIIMMDRRITMQTKMERKNRRKNRNKRKDIMISLQFFKRRNLEIF